jgi:CRP/FNR family transcriptional regulator
LSETRNYSASDLDRLSRLKALSWLSTSELALLVGALALADFKRREVILGDVALESEAHILLTGIARITCLNTRSERVTVALLAPGPIPEFPSSPISQCMPLNFRCEAYNDCRVGSLSWHNFDVLTGNSRESAFKKFHQNDLKQWYRVLLHSSGFLNLELHDRVVITLLDLCSDFGIEESRGTLLGVSLSHNDIANLVGASRPRVTEQLAQLERDRFVIRQGRQLIVRVGKLADSMTSPAT